MTEQQYKWAYPSDWLNDKIDAAEPTELRGIVNAIVTKLAEDDIQDLFQAEMDADGYFRPLRQRRT
jgi:hypothetical protein